MLLAFNETLKKVIGQLKEYQRQCEDVPIFKEQQSQIEQLV